MKSVASVKISFPTNLLHNPAAAPIYACIESLLCRTIILLHPAAHSSIALCLHCALQHNLLHPNAAQRFYLLPMHCVSTVQYVQYVLLCTGCTQSIRAKFRAVQSSKNKRKNKLKKTNNYSFAIKFNRFIFGVFQPSSYETTFHERKFPHECSST